MQSLSKHKKIVAKSPTNDNRASVFVPKGLLWSFTDVYSFPRLTFEAFNLKTQSKFYSIKMPSQAEHDEHVD
jgi:hypothetical protein